MASVRQIRSQVEKQGADKASWLCFWRDPTGKQRSKSFGPGSTGKRKASRFAKTVEAELHLGTYERASEVTWSRFWDEYLISIIDQLGDAHGATAVRSLKPWVRIAKPNRMNSIDTRMIDRFIAERKQERGMLPGSKLSPASLHKELTYLRSALRIAHEWGYINAVPKIRFPKLPEEVKPWISMEEFTRIYAHCDLPNQPTLPNISTGDWWRAFLTTLFMTGWRVSQVRAIRWQDVDLEERTIISPHSANKGKRDEYIPMHPVIAEHLSRIRGTFSDLVFPFVDAAGIKLSKDQLLLRFRKIQAAAGITPRLKPAGQWYAWHDFRRGFATANAADMDLFELQRLMQHRSLATTQRYVAMAERLERPVDKLKVPEGLRRDESIG